MTDFIRPEARAALVRLQGVLVALATVALGLWWVLAGGGILRWLGWALLAGGLALAWTAVQRLRFARGVTEDPGVVEVVEGQVSYFGPAGGGFAALDDVAEILLASRGADRAWVLRRPGQPDLVIPLGAAGADRLFDAFGSLPGLTGAALVAAVTPPAIAGGPGLPARVTPAPALRRVWRRPPRALR